MEEKKPPQKKKPCVLFVCTANICRSPMAAALFSAQIKKVRSDWQDWQVESAGTWAPSDKPASKNSQKAMAKRGLDIRGHRSRSITAEIVADADLILTMEAGHKEALCLEFPFAASRIFLLNEMVGITESIADPYGLSMQEYEVTASWMENVIQNGMARMIAEALGDESKTANE